MPVLICSRNRDHGCTSESVRSTLNPDILTPCKWTTVPTIIGTRDEVLTRCRTRGSCILLDSLVVLGSNHGRHQTTSSYLGHQRSHPVAQPSSCPLPAVGKASEYRLVNPIIVMLLTLALHSYIRKTASAAPPTRVYVHAMDTQTRSNTPMWQAPG